MQGIIVLIVYALLMVGATKAFTKREDGGESFHVGHRNMGMVVSAMSIAAPIHGRHDNGRDPSKTDGKKSTRLSRI